MPTSSGDLAALHAILGFQIPVFIPFLLLKYHKADASDPFHDNSLTILTFFIATLIYVAAMATELNLRIRDVECPNVISNISKLSAPLASVSLVMIALPRLGWFLLVIWIGFFVKQALDSYQEFFGLFREAADRCANYLLIWIKLLRREAKQEEIKDQSSATSNTSSDHSIV